MSTKDLRENTVWEEAGGEFYQENYKGHRSGSRIPLPSHTARRNSGWKTGTGMYTARRGTTIRGTGVDYNIVDGIPDLADESIGNEKSSYEQLKSFKRMPISMAEKRGLKGQLQTNPILKLMGWTGLKWRLSKGLKHFAGLRRHFTFTVFANQLRSIECRAGFAFVTFFEEIKKLLFLNLLTAVVYAVYMAYPYIIESVAYYGQMGKLNETETVTNATNNAQDFASLANFEWQNVTQVLLNKRSFIFYSFDNATPKLVLTLILLNYSLSLISCFANTWGCLKEKIERKYIQSSCCDLIFAGWHYFTRCKSGAEFKRLAVQREIQSFLQDGDCLTQNQLGLFGIRTCVNVINLMLISVATLLLWHIQEFAYEFYWESDKYEQLESVRFLIYFLPQIYIITLWFMLSCIVERMGKWEKYPHKTQVFVLVLRCWALRLILLACFITKFYSLSYFEREVTPVRVDEEAAEEACWETHFAKELYKFLVVDLSIKIFLTFVLEPIRVLMGKLCSIFGAVHFHCVSNYLDIICIQGLAWIGIYFAPLFPLAMALYLVILFLVKSFSLQANVKGAPDIFRPMESLIIKVKLTTLALGAISLMYVFGFMRPSSTCGPFQDNATPWEYIKDSIRDFLAHEVIRHLKCPQWSLPLLVLLLCVCFYYKCVIRNGEKMIDTLKHLLVLEGHDKQFLFRRVEAMQAGTSTTTIDNN